MVCVRFLADIIKIPCHLIFRRALIGSTTDPTKMVAYFCRSDNHGMVLVRLTTTDIWAASEIIKLMCDNIWGGYWSVSQNSWFVLAHFRFLTFPRPRLVVLIRTMFIFRRVGACDEDCVPGCPCSLHFLTVSHSRDRIHLVFILKHDANPVDICLTLVVNDC